LAAAAAAVCVPAMAQTIGFSDVSSAAGLTGFTHSPNSLAVPGLNEWIMGGLGVGDFNNDGWPDFFVPRGGAGTDRLYINNGNGTFTNASVAWGVSAAHAGNGVACADFDRDGDTDIFVSSYGTGSDNLGQIGKHRLYRNQGTTFVEVAASFGVNTSATTGSVANGVAWGDYDLDGDLDLAMAGWSSAHFGNKLFRNDGPSFTDATPPVLMNTVTWGFQPAIIDITGDGFPELLIAADFETGRAFRNLANGQFALATGELGLGLDDNGMGHAIGDFDRDGRPDYYVTSIHMDQPNAGMYNGNTLYMQQASGNFVELASARGCSDGGWGWGTAAVDLNHDGWEDIVEVNGRNASEWANEQEYIFQNLGGATFTRLGATTGINLAADTRSVATLDYDRDGDMDLLMLVNAGAVKLYRNNSTMAGRWLQVQLSAAANTRCAPHGLGAVIECTSGSVVQKRWMHGGSGYNSNNEYLAHFGIPTQKGDLTVRVDWPSGQTTVLTGVAANQRISVAAPARSDIDADGGVGTTDLAALLSAWELSDRTQRAMRAADLNGDGQVGATDLAALLSDWTE
jgi:enediyne biosynthesis protein E4